MFSWIPYQFLVLFVRVCVYYFLRFSFASIFYICVVPLALCTCLKVRILLPRISSSFLVWIFFSFAFGYDVDHHRSHSLSNAIVCVDVCWRWVPIQSFRFLAWSLYRTYTHTHTPSTHTHLYNDSVHNCMFGTAIGTISF